MRVILRRGFFGIAAATLLTWACASDYGDEVTPSADGGADAPVGPSTLDASGSSSSSGDATVPMDAAGETSTATFCTQEKHDFCDDFEREGNPQKFYLDYGQHSGTYEIDKGTLKVALQATDANGATFGQAAILGYTDNDTTWSTKEVTIRYGMRVLVSKCPPEADNRDVELGSVSLSKKVISPVIRRSGSDCIVRLREMVQAEDGVQYKLSTALSIKLDTWTTLRMNVPPNAVATGKVTLEIDGDKLEYALTPTVPEARTFYAKIGLADGSFRGTDAAATFDDFFVDYR